jgi:hypothetical protein
MMTTIKQYPTGQTGPSVELIPPLASRFDELPGAGTDESIERAFRWALDHRVFLVTGVPTCAHGLYLMTGCPGDCHKVRGLDHVQLWVPADRPFEPFILTQPYESSVPKELQQYGNAHGLEVLETPYDSWYLSEQTISVRLTARAQGAAFPLGIEAVAQLAMFPTVWPARSEYPR